MKSHKIKKSSEEEDTSKTVSKKMRSEITEVPQDVKHLQPGTEGSILKSKNKRKKAEEIENDELPMEERLNNLTVTTPTTVLRENNLAHLLSQGLHSKDTRILHSVLSRFDEEIIANTVRSLPTQLVVPLIDELKLQLAGKGQLNNSVIKWLKSVIQIHSSYLMSNPSLEELLSPLMSLINSRQVLYPQMCQLKGKLLLIKAQIEAKQYRSELPNEALLVFNDDSEEGENDMGMPSDSEEILSSDDLGVEDDSTEDEKDNKSEEEDEEGTSELSDDADSEPNLELSSDEDKTTAKSSNQTKSSNASKPLANGDGSDFESMDEDA